MDSLFKTNTGKTIVSILWALGIAALFYKVCETSGCFVLRESSNPDIEHNIYEFKNECFKGNSGSSMCSPVYPPAQEQQYPPKCDQLLFTRSPTIDYYEFHSAKNCGDPRHCNEPSCYKFNPTDSIFRAPSQQIYYSYH